MEKTSKELLKEFVNSQQFTSTTDIMNSMKELFSDILQQVMEAELQEKLEYEKSDRTSDSDETCMSKNYRNGYSKKTVKTQLGEVDVKIPRDRNGEYEPQIIGKYNRNADGIEEKILALYARGMSQRDISEQIKMLYSGESIDIRNSNEAEIQMLYYFKRSGFVDVFSPKPNPTGHIPCIFAISELGKEKFSEIKKEKSAKTGQWIGYIITTAIALLGFIKSFFFI